MGSTKQAQEPKRPLPRPMRMKLLVPFLAVVASGAVVGVVPGPRQCRLEAVGPIVREGNLSVGWTRRWVGRCVIDDQVSFEQYVRERGRALARTGAFLLGDPQLGEDLAQEVLAALSLRWRRVSRADNVEAYVYRAMTNTATSWRRRRSWAELPVDRVPEIAAIELPPYDDQLLSALRALPPRQRAVVVLRYYADRTEVQTAAALGCSVGTVKSQHANAVASLRASLPTADLA